MQARTKHTPCLLAAGGAGGGNLQPIPDQQVWVWIEGAADKVTKRCFFASNMADVFKIDTSVIPEFNKHALIEKLVQGLPDFQGKWTNVCTVVMAFAPGTYSRREHANKALAKTSIADYPSRKEVHITSNNVS